MDLKSMLNDSATQRPPRIHTLHTPHSSYDACTDQTPTPDFPSARPASYGPASQAIESRLSGGGSYFAAQSPHPNASTSASTPIAGPHAVYAQSPGTHQTSYTPRESVPKSHPYNAPFVSPSPPVVHNPPTPGSAHISYNHPGVYANSTHTPTSYQFQSPPPPQANGLPHSYARQITPTTQFQSQPSTPLGPPIHYQKRSPHPHRPGSQGHDQHLRQLSRSSIGSAHSNDYSQHPLSISIDPTRRDSTLRSLPYDIRERERSISVSPKTIPRPAPYREHSTSSQTLSQGRQSIPPQRDSYLTMSHSNSVDQAELAVTPQAASQPIHNSTPPLIKQHSNDHTLYQSPAHGSIHERKSVQASSSRQESVEPSPVQTDRFDIVQSALKRSASHLSDSPARNKEHPVKRRRREETPVWAQSARGDRRLNLMDENIRQYRPPPTTQHQSPPASSRPAVTKVNGKASQGPPAQTAHSLEPVQPAEPVGADVNGLHWESTLADTIPIEDLTRSVCSWILHHIKDAVPPRDSIFEIEAKIGQIIHNEQRLYLPIFSEAIINREKILGKVKFDSTVHLVSHVHSLTWNPHHN